MDIRTTNLSFDSLAARKEVRTPTTNFETPKKAFQVGKLRGSEAVSSLTRGVAEIYTTAGAGALTNSRDGSSVLRDKLGPQSRSAEDDEFVVPFIQYDDTASLTSEDAAEIVRLEVNYGDIVTVPLMTPLVDAADDGDSRSTVHVSAIIENTRVFLDAVEELQVRKPVMGVIPVIGEDCTLALLDLYRECDLDAYCVDFNRRSPMAQFQIDEIVGPLMGRLTASDDRDDHLFYAVNTKNSRSGVDERRTPDRMYSYAAGFDIVGDNHISPNWPEEVFEEIARQNKGSETTLRLFDGENMAVAEVPVSDLDSFLPADVGLSVRRIQDRIAENPDERFRFRNLINAELISLYLESADGVDPQEIFNAIQSATFTLDRDLQRIEELVAGVNDHN
jgi:hypothetical protein